MHAAEWAGTQAAGLQRMVHGAPVRVLAVSSGKGGVGKTNVSINLAIALAERGRDVMLLDGDLGLGNTDVLLGLHSRYNLSHVLDGECSLEDIIIRAPGGVKLIPASSGIPRMLNLDAAGHATLIRAFGDLRFPVDTLIVDTAAGVSESVVAVTRACQEIVVVVRDEPASITDAYALIKVLHRECGRHRFRILANMTHTHADARQLFLKLVRASDRFLSVSLDFMGHVPFDEYVHKAIRRQRAVIDVYPRSRAALAFKNLATVTDKWPVPDTASGQLEFFVERLVHAGHGLEEARI